MDLLSRIDALLDQRHLLSHPFYTKWVAGTLPTGAIQEYARQYYAFESAFPQFLSSIHSRTEDRAARQTILDNLWDEEHGEENHVELWLRFAEGMGVSREDVTGATPNAATGDLVETYRRTAADGPIAAGLAAVHAYERQVPAVARAKIDGLRTHYGVDDARTLRFWEVHRTLDEEHSAGERAILEDAGRGEEDAVLGATGQALDAWWRFLDEVDVPDVA
jgi:pyrroloquinoline-quinone synthase